jgi:ferredoxin
METTMNRFNYKLILTLLVIVLALNIFSQVSQKAEVIQFTGKLKKIGDGWFLNTGEDFFMIQLSPEEFLQDNKILLESKKEIVVHGVLIEEEIKAYGITYEDIELKIRDEMGNPLWVEKKDEVKSYKVIPEKCIGCQLCVKYCPFEAIKMVKGIAVIDPEKCTACGICTDGNKDRYKGCPTNAIIKP